VTRSTFYNNSADWEGGAIYSGSFNIDDVIQTLYLTSLTYADNECTVCHDNIYIWSPGAIEFDSESATTTTTSTSTSTTSSPSDANTNMLSFNSYFVVLLTLFIFVIVN